jgi:hypothetical protein
MWCGSLSIQKPEHFPADSATTVTGATVLFEAVDLGSAIGYPTLSGGCTDRVARLIVQTSTPVFVVSTGRSGSQMIAQVLGQHPMICALHEPRPLLNTLAYAKWRGLKDDNKIRANLQTSRADLIQQVKTNHFLYVESSHFLSHLIPELYELFGGKFVHLHRNGVDFVKSGLRRTWYRRPSAQEAVKTLIRRRLILELGDTYRDHRLTPPLRYRSRIAKITWLWVEINTVILEAMEGLPSDRKLSLSLESVSEETIGSLLEFVEAPIDHREMAGIMGVVNSRPNRTTRTAAAPYSEEWSRDDYDTFFDIASTMMRKLNYSTELKCDQPRTTAREAVRDEDTTHGQ